MVATSFEHQGMKYGFFVGCANHLQILQRQNNLLYPVTPLNEWKLKFREQGMFYIVRQVTQCQLFSISKNLGEGRGGFFLKQNEHS